MLHVVIVSCSSKILKLTFFPLRGCQLCSRPASSGGSNHASSNHRQSGCLRHNHCYAACVFPQLRLRWKRKKADATQTPASPMHCIIFCLKRTSVTSLSWIFTKLSYQPPHICLFHICASDISQQTYSIKNTPPQISHLKVPTKPFPME